MMYLGYLTAETADVISFEKKPFSRPLFSLFLPSLQGLCSTQPVQAKRRDWKGTIRDSTLIAPFH